MKSCDFDWKQVYNRFHHSFPGTQPQPVIGITGNFGEKGCELAEGYYQSVLSAGATPLIIPPYEQPYALANLLDHIDALLLSGGGDLNPLLLGEEPIPQLHDINHRRDLQELLLVRLAYDRQIPILGICRGIQVLVAALEGTLYQDIYTQAGDNLIGHSQRLDRSQASHTIHITADSQLLRPLFGCTSWPVNSFHHQAVKESGPHLRVCATAPDGIIEAVESSEHKPILGVQWHPECFIANHDTSMMPLFEWLTQQATQYRRARQLHRQVLTLDSHCDTPMFFDQGIHFDQRDPKILVDLHKMHEGGLDAVVMVAYLEQKERTPEALQAATDKANHILTQIEKMVAASPDAVGIARTPDELYALKAAGKKAIMLGIENGYALAHDLRLVEHFRQRGVVYITLCHNGDNDICDSARGMAEHGGLSEFGRKVVQEMNRQGVLVDLSHAAESSFYDALELSKVPIVCSHSSCRSLCDVPRNLTDQQLLDLAKKGGVAQITLYHGFLKANGQASVLDAVDHINHAVDLMGIEHVGIGTDFDGDGGVPGCASAAELINLTRHLMASRYNEKDMAALWGGNFLRVMQQAQDARTI